MKYPRRNALGQHFLKDRRILNKIIKVVDPQPSETILEIGAGKGKLTFPLAERAGHVITVEKDRTLIPFLKERGVTNLTIIEGDILRFDFKALELPSEIKVAGNLPYSISTPLLFKIFEDRALFSRCIFLLQKEVADRLCASPGTKKYAPLSILFNNHFRIRLHTRIPPEAFSPPPRVDSALVSLEKRISPLFVFSREDLFRQFLKNAFGQRRKTLMNNLKSHGLPQSTLAPFFKETGIELKARPEQVTPAQFATLFSHLQNIKT